METILASPILWGIVSLLALALALSGRLDLNAAKWVLVLVWGLSTLSLYRLAPILHQPLVPRLLWTMLGASVIGLLLFWLSGWMSVRPPTASQPVMQANLPDFKISMLGGNAFIPDAEPTWTGMELEVRIRNIGAPSIATDWMLTVTPSDGQPVQARPTTPSSHLAVTGAKTGTVILPQDAFSLEKMAVASPLKAGDPPIESHVLFYVTIPHAKVTHADTILVLSASDFLGRIFEVKQRMGDWPQR